MAFLIARLLVVPMLALACSAQAAQPTTAEKREQAKRLAASFKFEKFHPHAAKGLAKLGSIGLPFIEEALREGTDIEARGALWSLLAVPSKTDRVITQLEWILTHRPKVVEIRQNTNAIIGYLRGAARENERAVDVLWSMLDGPAHDLVAYSLTSAGRNRARLVQHIARDLDSEDEKRVARAIGYLSMNPRFRRRAPEEFATAIKALFADEKRDLTKIEKLAKSEDRMTALCVRQFLKTYHEVEDLRQTNKTAMEKVAQMDDETRASHLVGMLDLPPLRTRAIAELATIGPPAVPVLKKALVHENVLVAEGAVRAFTQMKELTAQVPALLAKVLADKTKAADARITSMQFLSALMDSDPAVFAAIRKQTDAAEPTVVRIAAIRELAKTKKHRHDVVNLLETILRDKQLKVAEYATTTLGVMSRKEDQRIVMLLMRQLQSPHAKIQRAAIYGLAGKGAKIHLERLRKKPDLDASVKVALDRVLSQKKKELAGFLIADYSDNRIVQIDLKGEEVSSINEIFGVWDVELLDNGNFLITEFSVNRVSEVTPDKKTVWSFKDLKNPYDADRLPNGNTLIADTFGRRVIEVDKTGTVVWKYDTAIHPYDVDRLPNGNTLISDTHDDRIIEVDPSGKIVWDVKNVPNVHDADRLPNGNTLVTIRMLNEVREIDHAGKTVSTLKNLSSPSDADRLPDGRTVVAENGAVRIFDADGKEVWRKRITWAVEVSPVWKYQREAQKQAGGK